MTRRSWRTVGPAVLALVVASLTGCDLSDPSGDVTSRPTGSTAAARSGTPPATEVVGGRGRLAGFGEVTVTVVDAEGRTHVWCLLLADTDELRAQGLMGVDDPRLGGYDGMLFAFDDDVDGGFWMKDTLLPLSIAWIAADGTTVSTADMAPCPPDAESCPVYPPRGPYRTAVEVPQGRLGDRGIGPGSRLRVEGRSCEPVRGAARTLDGSG